MDRIDRVETFEARVPLAHPLTVGSARITHRTYSIVRITSSDGITGIGYCYSRGLPIAQIINAVITPHIIQQTAESPDEIRKRLIAANWQSSEHGTLTSGFSAVDIALTDIMAKRSGKSVAQFLGSDLKEIPVYSVIGYDNGHDETGLEEEIDHALSRGIKSFKIVVGAKSPQRDAHRIKVLRNRVGEKALIGVDAFRTFGDLEKGKQRVDLFKEYGISFIEDAFLESQGKLTIALREQTDVPVSFGESLASASMVEQVVDYNQVDVLRIDALVIGGVSEFLKAADYADRFGIKYSTHIHTEVHSQIAAATKNRYAGGIEYLDPKYEIDLFHHLLVKPIVISDGKAQLSTEPGFGIEWDWNAIQRYSA